MAAAKKPQSKFHIAKIHSAKLARIEDARKEALKDAPDFVNKRFSAKRAKAIAEIPDEAVPLMVAGSEVTQGEVEAAKLAALEAQSGGS